MENDFDQGATPLVNDFYFHQYRMHLQGLAEGDRNEAKAKAVVADIQRFFDNVPSNSKDSSLISKLLNVQNIENYVSTSKQAGKAATTIAKKLRRIRKGVRFFQLGL